MTTAAPSPLTWKQKFFLAAGVPAFIFFALEIAARIFLVTGAAEENEAQSLQLEMPTWMLHDANALARRTPSKDAVDWLSLFVEGRGFRVNLLPNISREVRNTFSLISADRERRYVIQSNSLGFRGKEIQEKKEDGTFRVLVFGDSSSFGWGVNYEDSWTSLLEKGLQKNFPSKKIEVGNFAIPGDSSAYGRLLFETFAARFNPDLVILGFGANDAKRVTLSHTEQVARFREHESLVALSKLLKVSALYRLLEQTLKPTAPNGGPKNTRNQVPAVDMKQYVENLRYMGVSAKEFGSKNALFLALCTPNDYAKAARGEARRNGFLWFNGQTQLLKLLPRIQSGEVYPEYVERMKAAYERDLNKNRRFYVTSDGCHPNELGHRFVADKLTDLITSAKLVR